MLVKKTIRKLTKFYIEPIASDQSEYNRHVATVLEIMHEALVEKDEEIKELREALKKVIAKNNRG
jgi:protein-arginine kinase activator protein McsA